VGRKLTVHVLQDGSEVTTKEVKALTGLTSNGAVRYRLKHAKTKEDLLKRASNQAGRRKSYDMRVYELSNGDKLTFKDLMEKTGISEASARSRLHASDDPEKIYAHKNQRIFKKKAQIEKAMKVLEEERKKVKVLYGIPVFDKPKDDRLMPAPMDICRNEWHLERDEYGFLNNGDD
jgi:hypothetical protein